MIIRRESIDRETGNRIAGEELESEIKAPAMPPGSTPSSFSQLAEDRAVKRMTLIQSVISKALKGELPREGHLPYWQVDKLNDTHIEMIFDSVQGLTQQEIAEKYDYTASQVGKILIHPDTLTIRAMVNSINADGLTDMQLRFQKLAPEMLSIKTDIVRDTSTPVAVRDRIATDILDRAGYGAVQKRETRIDQTINIPASVASRLVEGLDESNRVASVDYRKHLRSSQDDEVAQAANLLPSPGQTVEEGETLHTPGPANTRLGELKVRIA